ncbi:hypothetical protein CY34DRAFT_147375 [Suillus luteus UH-Slu-Lm8-n1]|uniref:Uncharacterized protein n=1 Tax=Suillus luteus UH-Slu-Lm8-n1 TaxID=930992 RepID=A0A0D0BDK1_9AGAM|nr:hypothetical protein CY34DRAFT_147375 [Suillus luteus UH-Slu-Lm8-n1]
MRTSDIACETCRLFLVMHAVTIWGTSSKPSSVCSGFAVDDNGGTGTIVVTVLHALQEASTFTLSPTGNPSSIVFASDSSNYDKNMS